MKGSYIDRMDVDPSQWCKGSSPDVEYHWRPDNKALQTDRASQLSLIQRGD